MLLDDRLAHTSDDFAQVGGFAIVEFGDDFFVSRFGDRSRLRSSFPRRKALLKRRRHRLQSFDHLGEILAGGVLGFKRGWLRRSGGFRLRLVRVGHVVRQHRVAPCLLV